MLDRMVLRLVLVCSIEEGGYLFTGPTNTYQTPVTMLSKNFSSAALKFLVTGLTKFRLTEDFYLI